MTDLKRKRSSSDPDSAQTASAETLYLVGVPDGLAELADVRLLVEGHELPVHSYTLRESPILLAAFQAACSDKQRVCQVPLTGEHKHDVLLLLKHMYRDDAATVSIPGAWSLATMAHKYNVTRLHKLSETYLVTHLGLTNASVFDWAEVAERLELNLLLAHCEQFIILNFHSMSATNRKVSSISRSSLLRVMEGLAVRGADKFDWAIPPKSLELSGMYLCSVCQELMRGLWCYKCKPSALGSKAPVPKPVPVRKLNQSTVPEVMAAIAPAVETLLRWQQRPDDNLT